MSIPGAASPLFIGAAAAGAAAYQIDRSLRFNSSDSAYLNRTPSSAGNRKTWTWSGWLKRSDLVANTFIFGAGSGIMVGGAHTAFMFTSGDKLQSYDYTGSGYAYNVVTTKLFRDPAAWYHIVLAIDTTQSTSTDRVKLYVNGELQTALDTTTYPSQNYETYVNTSSIAHQIGHSNSDSFDGYLAEIHFVDGTQLAASDFGEYDDNNNWNPKEYSGSYGTNGFYLNFANNSSNAALGYDANGTVRYHPDVTGTSISSTVKNLFDGSVATTVDGTAGTVITFTPSTAISYSSSVEVYTASSQTTRTYSLNGGSGVTNVANGWTSLATGSGTITSISQTPNTGYVHAWAAIRVDGTILTDPNDWTVNNLTAREEAWSNYLTTTGSFVSNQGPEKSFDGSISAADVPALDAGQPLTWSPPGGLAYSSKVEIYVGAVSGFTYSLNGASAVTATTNAWNTVDTGSGTINTLVFDRGVNETHGPHAIRVDNVILQDGTPSNTDSLSTRRQITRQFWQQWRTMTLNPLIQARLHVEQRQSALHAFN